MTNNEPREKYPEIWQMAEVLRAGSGDTGGVPLYRLGNEKIRLTARSRIYPGKRVEFWLTFEDMPSAADREFMRQCGIAIDRRGSGRLLPGRDCLSS